MKIFFRGEKRPLMPRPYACAIPPLTVISTGILGLDLWQLAGYIP